MDYSKVFNLIATTSKGDFPVTVNLIDNGPKTSKLGRKWTVDVFITIREINYPCSSFSAYAVQSKTSGQAFGRTDTVKMKLKGNGFRGMDKYRNNCDTEYKDSLRSKVQPIEKGYGSIHWLVNGMNGE